MADRANPIFTIDARWKEIYPELFEADLSEREKVTGCFQKVMEACQTQEALKRIQAAKGLVARLRDLNGESVFARLIQVGNTAAVTCALAQEWFGILSDQEERYLHLAISHNRGDLIPLLLEKKVCSLHERLKLDFDFSPVTWAVARGALDCFDALVERAPREEWNERIPGVGSLIHVAIAFYQNRMLEHLLTKHFSEIKHLLEASNDRGMMPLLWAVEKGDKIAVSLLCRKGSGCQQRDRIGNSPLHWAAMQGDREMIQLLVSHGADLTAFNDKLQRPSDCAQNATIATMLNNLREERIAARRLSPNFVLDPPHTLIFRGGIVGVHFIGVLQALEERKLHRSIERVSGILGGALIATLFACGCDSKQIHKHLKTLSSDLYLDMPPLCRQAFQADADHGIGAFFDLFFATGSLTEAVRPRTIVDRLKREGGVCEGKKIREWIENILKEVNIYTFGDLARKIQEQKGRDFKHLHLFGAPCGNPLATVDINSEDDQWKDAIVADAVQIAATPSLLFKSSKLSIQDIPKQLEGSVFGDVGLATHFGSSLAPCSQTMPLTPDSKICAASLPNSRSFKLFRYRREAEYYCAGHPPSLLEKFDLIRYVEPHSFKASHLLPAYNRRALSFYVNHQGTIQGISPGHPESILTDFQAVFYRPEKGFDDEGECRVVRIEEETAKSEFDPLAQKLHIKGGRVAAKQFIRKQAEPKANSLLGTRLINRQMQAPLFGRKKEMKILKEALLSSEEWDEKTTQVLVKGGKGVGKTACVNAVLNAYLDHFFLIIWINCNDLISEEPGPRSRFEVLIKELHIQEGEDSTNTEKLKMICRRLENSYRSKPWLIFFDNVEKIPLYPKRGGHVVMCSSSSNAALEGSCEMELANLSLEASVALLKEGLEGYPESDVQELAQRLNGNPSQLVEAVDAIKKNEGSIQDYMKTWLS